MFDNLNWWEIGALLLLALLIFGDRLPNVINDGLRMVRNLRNMARNATGDLSRELGTDIQLEDLHPKAFIRKHLLSEEDEQAHPQAAAGHLRQPARGRHRRARRAEGRRRRGGPAHAEPGHGTRRRPAGPAARYDAPPDRRRARVDDRPPAATRYDARRHP